MPPVAVNAVLAAVPAFSVRLPGETLMADPEAVMVILKTSQSPCGSSNVKVSEAVAEPSWL
ncbi:hypothetical protein D3C72_1497030 [compost metagenome]